MTNTSVVSESVACSPGADFVDQVRRALVACLAAGNPNLDRVAARLEISPRSLQRRLRHAGTSHRELLDRLRHDLALELVAEQHRSRRSVARALAYANSRSLWRALRRCAPDVVERVQRAKRTPADCNTQASLD